MSRAPHEAPRDDAYDAQDAYEPFTWHGAPTLAAGLPYQDPPTLPYGVGPAHHPAHHPAPYPAAPAPPAAPAAPAAPGPGHGPGTGTAPGWTPAAPPADPLATGPGRSARRSRRRPADPSEAARRRRLLPQALVVAFLAGGTAAYCADDKTVELTVDGRPRTLHTFADDVAELLAEEGVRVGTRDVVAPAPTAALAHGDEITVHYGRPVRLTIDGQLREFWTTADTVAGALDQLGVRAEGAFLSTSRSRRIDRAGLALAVRTERTVTILADGRERVIRTNAATVREAVDQAGVELRDQDTTSVPGGSFPRDGQTVTVLRITDGRETRDRSLPFTTRTVSDPDLLTGTTVVDDPGRAGLRRTTYAVRTVNGVRQRPRKLGSEVLRAPRQRVVRTGTKPRPVAARGTDRLDWSALAACESGGRAGAVDPSGTYGGLYQFDTQTWRSLGGTGRPQDAPPAEQTRRAKKLYIARGASPWPHCGTRL
ncbi:ubiquitin-like domain-containing protein [Streptomyces uncialis]|uniref:ubiquitin-like domain-containing protein n=1 Tax=Streptomyces uncialis TaxID=1048205 RepID=UPI0038117EE3